MDIDTTLRRNWRFTLFQLVFKSSDGPAVDLLDNSEKIGLVVKLACYNYSQ